MTDRPFLISSTIDFGDDCAHIVFTKELLAQLLERLHWLGVRRLYWNYSDNWWRDRQILSPATRQTLDNLGNPMAVAGRLAHERGLEFYAVIKPYEFGISHAVRPQDLQQAGQPGLPCIGGIISRADPWILAHPELRLRGRQGDLPAGLSQIPVQRIQLRQQDLAPLRFQANNLEVWTSPDNDGYRKRELRMTISEGVEACPHDVLDVLGHRITRQGDPVRVLNLAGLNLPDAFIAVTTNLDDDSGTFRNTALEMVRAFGPGEQPLPIVVASHKAVWNTPRDFRTGSLEYDAGHGAIHVCLDVTNQRPACPHCRERQFRDCMQDPLYADKPICRDGVIAFARGRNAYLPCCPCEAYPEVQEVWLNWVEACLLAGIDGLDVRMSNHSSWSDTPELYGFNEPVLFAYQRRYGVNPDQEPYDPALLAGLRGELYDEFLRRLKRRLAAVGKRLQVHLEVESFRSDAAPARRRTRPGNLSVNWQDWLRAGLADEATLMGVNWLPERVLGDAVGQEMLREAAVAHVPVHLRHFVWLSRDGQTHADQLEAAYRCGDLAGFNLYESAALYDGLRLGADGRLAFYPGLLEALRSRGEALGLLG